MVGRHSAIQLIQGLASLEGLGHLQVIAQFRQGLFGKGLEFGNFGDFGLLLDFGSI